MTTTTIEPSVKSILALSKKYLLNNGYVYNVYCGLTPMWMFCLVCDRYTWKTPYQNKEDKFMEEWVCDNCNCASRLVG